VVLWVVAESRRLSPTTRDVIVDPATVVTFSAASVWELAIKQATGRVSVPDDFVEALVERDFTPLAIGVEHARAAAALPPLHNDPFDRMLVAQAQLEGLTLVTRDLRLRAYDVATLAA
jgi:PIN domain nuclease of toxin-antitoxin system